MFRTVGIIVVVLHEIVVMIQIFVVLRIESIDVNGLIDRKSEIKLFFKFRR